jgi:hypothetical protein
MMTGSPRATPKIDVSRRCAANSISSELKFGGIPRGGSYDGVMPRTSPSSMAGLVAQSMSGVADLALRRWAACGAMALTGDADGPPSSATARVALAADALATTIADLSGRVGSEVLVDGAALLGERAALAGLTRHGSRSCGGATRLLRASDGWLALTLARPDDVQLVDAWLGAVMRIPIEVPVEDWAPIEAAVVQRTRADLVATAVLLGLPCASLGEVSAASELVGVAATGAGSDRLRVIERLTVVDLSSLWAGPLCAQLLGLAGAQIVKVESSTRPDGARLGPPEFFDLLHPGHRSVALDFAADDGRRWLRRLIASADIVIEASRPRALAALGASFDVMHDAGWRGVWLSITGYGRTDETSGRVAFGDDAAVGGGLVSEAGGAPIFCADAVADPLSGLLAAATVLECLDRGATGFIDVSLARTAAHVAAGVRRMPLSAPTAPIVAAPPRARRAPERAAALGAHTDAVLSAL